MGIFCLYTALDLHNLSSHIAKSYYIAIDNQHHYKPSLPNYPSIILKYFTGKNYYEGIEELNFGNHKIQVYNMEKTLCDFIRLGIVINGF